MNNPWTIDMPKKSIYTRNQPCSENYVCYAENRISQRYSWWKQIFAWTSLNQINLKDLIILSGFLDSVNYSVNMTFKLGFNWDLLKQIIRSEKESLIFTLELKKNRFNSLNFFFHFIIQQLIFITLPQKRNFFVIHLIKFSWLICKKYNKLLLNVHHGIRI